MCDDGHTAEVVGLTDAAHESARWWSRTQVSPRAAEDEDIDEEARLPGHWQDFVRAQFSKVGVSFYR